MNGVNLLPSPLRDARTRRRRIVLWARIGVAYAVVIAIGLVAADGMIVEPVHALVAETKELEADILATDAGIAKQQKQAADLESSVRVLRDIHGQPDWSIMLRHLAGQLQGRAAIRSVRVELAVARGEPVTPSAMARGTYIVDVDGIAGDQSAATEYVLNLERAGMFEAVSLEGTSPTRIGTEDGVLFGLRGVIGIRETK